MAGARDHFRFRDGDHAFHFHTREEAGAGRYCPPESRAKFKADVTHFMAGRGQSAGLIQFSTGSMFLDALRKGAKFLK